MYERLRTQLALVSLDVTEAVSGSEGRGRIITSDLPPICMISGPSRDPDNTPNKYNFTRLFYHFAAIAHH